MGINFEHTRSQQLLMNDLLLQCLAELCSLHYKTRLLTLAICV